MSADEDTELRDLVAQTLETNGTLGKLRAQLRASVFLALEDQENGQKAPFLNKELRSFLSTHDGKLVAGLVQEFLEFFNLEFTLAVFKPETGLNGNFKRANLIKELNIQTPKGQGSSPLLSYLIHSDNQGLSNSSSNKGTGDQLSKNLTEKQIEDARQKFDYYDKDGSGSIDKDELRDLFIDMFPGFHRNMLDRYVNDEFKAVDRDFSSCLQFAEVELSQKSEMDNMRKHLKMKIVTGFNVRRFILYNMRGRVKAIDFDEFLGMYKRLFLFCRTVVAGDVSDIISPSHKPTDKSPKSPPSSSAPQKKTFVQSKAHSNGGGEGSSDIEDDPFFDDHPASSPVSFNTLSNVPESSVSSTTTTKKASPYRPSQIPRFQRSELEKNKDSKPDGPASNNWDGKGGKGKQPSAGGMSSLDGLPSLTGGRGMGSLAGAPPLGRPKSPNNDTDLDQNLRAIDKRMEDLGLDSHDDYEYEDDFSPEHSMSHKISKGEAKTETAENGSIAEEIDDEEIDDISIEADDLLRSDKSGFDDLTTDHSVSQADGGFDYMEDPVLP